MGEENKKIKTLSVKEFQERGYLQELNRQFLHPLGLAISVIVNEETGIAESFGDIWDYRDDPEGIIFADLFTPEMVRKAKDISEEQKHMNDSRRKSLGYEIQPIKEESSMTCASVVEIPHTTTSKGE